MNKVNILLTIFLVFVIHYFDGFKNIYKIYKRSYESRMQSTHGFCEKESFGFYNDMVKKYEINKYKVIQENYESYPLLRGFFYEKDIRLDKKFVLILNYPYTNLPETLKVEGKEINLAKYKGNKHRKVMELNYR